MTHPHNLLTQIESSYTQLVEAALEGQKPLRANRLVNRCQSAAAQLAQTAIYFHLNFFKPNFLGSANTTDFQRCLKEMVCLFSNKNRDYGNSFRFWGVTGLLVRIGDKVFRLQQLSTKNYRQKVGDEKTPDTALDLANYSLMLLMLLGEGRSLKLGQ